MRKSTQRGGMAVESSDFKPVELDTGSATLKPKAGGSSKSKKGGDLISDVKGLAVPFAILLAKQGLDMAMKKDAKKTPPAKKTVKKVATVNRKATLAGGDCTLCNKKGGAKKSSEANDIHDRFKVLSKQIDDFLKKY